MNDIVSPDKLNIAQKYEREILSHPGKYELVECPVNHDFCDGVYSRSTELKKGTLAVGATHRHESFFVVRYGMLLLTTDEGDKLVGSGFMIMTKPGTKRIAFALTDSIVTTFHANPTNEQNEDKLWDAYTIPEHEAELLDRIEQERIE